MRDLTDDAQDNVDAAIPGLLQGRVGQRPPRKLAERWCPYPIAPPEWCALNGVGEPIAHHDPDLLHMVHWGVSASDLPTTRLDGVPRPGSVIYFLDVSICTQADVGRRY